MNVCIAGYQRKGQRVPDHGASHSNLLDLKYPELPQLRENTTVGDSASTSGMYTSSSLVLLCVLFSPNILSKKNEGARKDTNTKDGNYAYHNRLILRLIIVSSFQSVPYVWNISNHQ